MGTEQSNAILRRKTVAAREVYQARVLSPAKALRLAFARAADEVMGLALAVGEVVEDRLPLEALVAALPADALTLLLEGEEGLAGAISADFAVVSGLLEVQTMGRLQRTAPEPRRLTRTDAALTAPLIDAAWAQLEETLAAAEDGQWLRGYRFGAMMEGPRMLGLALEDGEYHLLKLTLDLGGTRQGQLRIALPPRAAPARAAAGAAPEDADAPPPMLRAVGPARAELTAELHRLRMPWKDLAGLQVGDLLPVPRSALASTTLLGPGGRRVLRVRLGQMNGARAVRLTGTDAPDRRDPPQAAASAAPAATFVEEEPAAPAPAMPPPRQLYVEEEEEEAAPPPTRIDALDGLPDLSDLPGLGEEDEEGALPMQGFPMADLSGID